MVPLIITAKRPRGSLLRMAARPEWNPRCLRPIPKTRNKMPVELEVLWAGGRAMFHCSKQEFAEWHGSQGDWEELSHVIPVDDPGYVPQWFNLPNSISCWFASGGKMPDWKAAPARDYGNSHPDADKWSSLAHAFRKHLYDNGAKVQRPTDGRKVIFHRMKEDEQIEYVKGWCGGQSDTPHPDEHYRNMQRYRTPVWADEAAGNDPFDYARLSSGDVRPACDPPEEDGYVTMIPTLIVKGEMDDGLRKVQEWKIPVKLCHLRDTGDGPQVAVAWNAMDEKVQQERASDLFVLVPGGAGDYEMMDWAAYQQHAFEPANPEPPVGGVVAAALRDMLRVPHQPGKVKRRRITKEEAEGVGGEIKVYETLPPLPPKEAEEFSRHTTLASALRVAKVPLRITRAADLWAAPREMGRIFRHAIEPIFNNARAGGKDVEIGVQWKLHDRGRWQVRMLVGGQEHVLKKTVDSHPAIEQAMSALHLDECRFKLTVSKSRVPHSGEFSVRRGVYRVLSFDGWLNARSKFHSAWGNLEVNLVPVAAHEMTHARQSAEGYWHGNAPMGHIKKNPLLYYLDDCEIEAYCRQLTTEAHIKGKTFTEVLHGWVSWQADYPDRRLHADEKRKVVEAYTRFYNTHYAGYIELPPKHKGVTASVAASLGITSATNKSLHS